MKRLTYYKGGCWWLKLFDSEFSCKEVDRIAQLENEAEQRENGCVDCIGKAPYCYTEMGIQKKMNYCATCGRRLSD